MSFLLHRDACVGWVRGRRALAKHVQQNRGKLHISALTILPLEYWVMRSTTPYSRVTGYLNLCQEVKQFPVDEAVAHEAAKLGGHFRRQNQRRNTLVLITAATALVHGLTLVTHDTQVFANVAGLTLADWFIP
jgi:predicted nucleic acid-binding protein